MSIERRLREVCSFWTDRKVVNSPNLFRYILSLFFARAIQTVIYRAFKMNHGESLRETSLRPCVYMYAYIYMYCTLAEKNHHESGDRYKLNEWRN